MSNLWLSLIKAALDAGERLWQRWIDGHSAPSIPPVILDQPYGAHLLQRLDAYRPAADTPLPVVVFIHGGGWLSGDKATYTRVCQVIAQAGFLAVNLNYRLAPAFRYPAPLQDVAAALDWIYANAADYGGDSERIYLAGESAGAYLALWCAAALRSPTLQAGAGVKFQLPAGAVKGLGLFFGLFDLENEPSAIARIFVRAFLGEAAQGSAGAARLASPVNFLGPQLPPAMIVCGERDVLYARSRALAQALQACDARVEPLFFPARAYPDAGHAFLKYPNRRCTQEALAAWIAFMRNHPS